MQRMPRCAPEGRAAARRVAVQLPQKLPLQCDPRHCRVRCEALDHDVPTQDPAVSHPNVRVQLGRWCFCAARSAAELSAVLLLCLSGSSSCRLCSWATNGALRCATRLVAATNSNKKSSGRRRTAAHSTPYPKPCTARRTPYSLASAQIRPSSPSVRSADRSRAVDSGRGCVQP